MLETPGSALYLFCAWNRNWTQLHIWTWLRQANLNSSGTNDERGVSYQTQTVVAFGCVVALGNTVITFY
jgi:hypothetical protein